MKVDDLANVKKEEGKGKGKRKGKIRKQTE